MDCARDGGTRSLPCGEHRGFNARSHSIANAPWVRTYALSRCKRTRSECAHALHVQPDQHLFKDDHIKGPLVPRYESDTSDLLGEWTLLRRSGRFVFAGGLRYGSIVRTADRISHGSSFKS